MELTKNILASLGVLFPIGWAIWKFWFENKIRLSITNITYYYDGKNLSSDKNALVNYPTLGFDLYNFGSYPLMVSGYEFKDCHFYWSKNYGDNVIYPHKPMQLKIPVLLIKNKKLDWFILNLADGRNYRVPKKWIRAINENVSADRNQKPLKKIKGRLKEGTV